MTNTATSDWIDYWQTLPKGRLFFSPEAEEVARNLRPILSPSMRVLDYGCGYGGVTRLIAPYIKQISFWDAAASMRDAAAQALADVPNAVPWDNHGGFDLILVNSVVQYMSEQELSEHLREWFYLLNPHGSLLLADLLLTNHRVISDILSLLSFSIRRGYFFSALRNTLAERRRYDRTAAATPLFHVEPSWLEVTARRCGYSLQWQPRNLTHFRGRRTAMLVRPE